MAQNTPPTAAIQKKQILILGGSYAGVSTAHYLLKHAIPQLPDPSSYQIVLVSPSTHAICRPGCPRALISDDLLPLERFFASIPEAFAGYPEENFRFVHGKATGLDHDGRTVEVALAAGGDGGGGDGGGGGTEKLHFHALVIATGASTPSPLLGLNHHDDVYLREQWSEFRKALPSAKSIVIAGGGPSGIETAGELGDFLNGRRAGWFASSSSKLENPKVRITVVTGGAQILPLLRPSIARKAEELLGRLGVEVVKGRRVTGVVPADAGTLAVGSKATVELDDGTRVEADMYIPALGTRPNTSFVDNSLLAPDGRVDTNPSTLRVDKAGPRVYAVGDVASYSRPAIHLLTSAIPVLGANIKRDLLLAASPGGESTAAEVVGGDREFKEDKRETHLVPIGRGKGVGAAMGYRLPSFLVWLIKGRDYWLWTVGGLWSGRDWDRES